jgi:hypothetical protein
MFFESSGLVHSLTNQCTSPLDSKKTSGHYFYKCASPLDLLCLEPYLTYPLSILPKLRQFEMRVINDAKNIAPRVFECGYHHFAAYIIRCFICGCTQI